MERSADWMDEAEGDLEHARHDAGAGYYNWACFSAQQAAEKAVKAVFQKRHGEAWGHSIVDLLTNLGTTAPISSDIMEKALELDKAYIPTRYPDAHQSGSPRRRYTRAEAERLVNHAETIVVFCKGLLSQA